MPPSALCSPEEEEKQYGAGGSDLSFHSLFYGVIQHSLGMKLRRTKVEDVKGDGLCC